MFSSVFCLFAYSFSFFDFAFFFLIWLFVCLKKKAATIATILEWFKSSLFVHSAGRPMPAGCGFPGQTHNPPQLRSTGIGTLRSKFSSAVFIRMASRLPDTLPFWTALISFKRKRRRTLSKQPGQLTGLSSRALPSAPEHTLHFLNSSRREEGRHVPHRWQSSRLAALKANLMNSFAHNVQFGSL